MGLLLGLIFGGVGTVYLIYAKKTHNGILAIAGALLCVYPYFFSSVLAVFVVGVILTAAPFVINRFS